MKWQQKLIHELSHHVLQELSCKCLLFLIEITLGKLELAAAESGNYTEKYDKAAEMIAAYDPLASTLDKPERPPVVPATAYPEVQLTEFIPYREEGGTTA